MHNSERIILNEQTGKELVKKVHIAFGHIGEKHIINTLKPHYYFGNMYKVIKKISTECVTCKKNKSRKGEDFGLLGHFGPPKEPYEIIEIMSRSWRSCP